MRDDVQWANLVNALLADEDLSVSQSYLVMDKILRGDITDAQLAAFLIALRAKGESVEEIIGFRNAILEHALPINVSSHAVDIVGTGGDTFGTVNVSTMAAIVIAGAGIPVIKHGNRAASSLSGSSDVLSELGIPVTLSPSRISKIFSEIGITYIPASVFHPGFAHAAAVRRQIGVPTVFNFLGPLCNPARPRASAIGVANSQVVSLIVDVFRSEGLTAMVFRGEDGLDELTTTGHSRVWEISQGEVTEHDIDPEQLGIQTVSIDALRGGKPSENAQTILRTLSGEPGPVRDIVVLNAAIGMLSYRLSVDPGQSLMSLTGRLAASLGAARESIDSGAARRLLDSWRRAAESSLVSE